MKIGIHTNIYGRPGGEGAKMAVEDMIRELAGIGYDGVELPIWSLLTPQREELVDRRSLRHLVEEVGIEVFAMGGYTSLHVTEPQQRRANIKILKENLQLASDLGAPVMTTDSGGLTPGQSPEEALSLIADGLRQCVETAERLNVKIGLENHGRLLYGSEPQLKIIGAVGSRQVGAIIDPWNVVSLQLRAFGKVKEWPWQTLQRLKGRLVHTHLCDYRMVKGQPRFAYPCEGQLRMRGFIETLKASGYAGNIGIEHKGPRPENPKAVAREIQKRMRKIISEIEHAD